MKAFPQNSTVVVVHGAWADGSCWSNVILPLERHSLKVISAPIPSGPVVLAAHAYGGAVIAATREERVKSLGYIAAFAPDEHVAPLQAKVVEALGLSHLEKIA